MRKSVMIFLCLLLAGTILYGQVPEYEIDYYDSINIKEIRINTPDSSGIIMNQGLFIRYLENGNRTMEGTQVNGKPDGTVITYRDDLSKKSKAVYKAGEKISEVQYDSLGILPVDAPDSLNVLVRTSIVELPNRNKVKKVGYDRTEKIFVNHGPATVWYFDGGNIFEMGNFKEGKPHGLMTRWSPFGGKQFEGSFKEGKYDGVWIYWGAENKIDSITIYNNDIVMREILPVYK